MKVVKVELIFAFSIIDISFISFFQGLKMKRDQEKQIIKLSQLAYIDKVLVKLYLNKAHTINTVIKKTAIFEQKTEKKTLSFEKKCYQGMTRSIMFFMVEIRPNILFATLVTNCFAKNPSHQYTKAVKSILQYLKSSKNREILYKNQNKLIVE